MTQRKIALVSRDLSTVPDFSSCLPRILEICDHCGADTVLFSLWSYDSAHLPLSHRDLFGQARCIQKVLLECCDLRSRSDCTTLVWLRNQAGPEILHQRFARAVETQSRMREFIADFERRRFGNDFVILCGESNVIKIRMRTGAAADEFGFLRHLDRSGIILILNPIHDYMVRHEMKKKRAALSANRRWVLSVWNMGKRSLGGKQIAEAHEPWTAFHDGQEMTQLIHETASGVSSVRIGLIEISQ